MRNAELMVATLRIYISACCLERFGFLGVIDISVTFDNHYGHGTPCPYDCNTNVSYIAVGDGIPDVPKRHLNINLKFGLQFFPNKPTFPLDLPAEALG